MAISMELESLRNNIEVLDRILKYLPEGEKRIKTIPSIFNRIYDENFISDFLAYVLDPTQNGIGFEPLIRVIEGYSENGANILQNNNLVDINNIEIIREYSFSSGRRIDILIKYKDELIIAIENKIFATELENQTIDYADSIYGEFPDQEYVLLFLTRKGVKPECDDFLPISYKKLVSKLQKVRFDYRDDIRRKVIFDEFILHVEEYMMDKNLETIISEQTRLYLEYQETIEKLERHFKEDSTMVFNKFEGMIRSIFDQEKWVINLKGDREYQLIYKPAWDIEGQIFIHHEFWISDNTNLGKKNILSENKILYFIEIEKKSSGTFLELFDKEYEKIKDEYIKNGIEYRPSYRRNAIGHIEIDNYFRPDYKGENGLVDEIEKLRFIEDAIERVYKLFLENNNQK